MRLIFGAAFMGAGAGALIAGLVVVTDTPWIPLGARLVLMSAASVAIAWWVLGAARAVHRAVRRRWGIWRARRARRRDFASERAYMPPPTFGGPDATVIISAPASTRVGRRKLEALRGDAEEALGGSDLRRARGLYTQVLRARPSVDAYLARGRIHLDLFDLDDALADFMAAEDLDPMSPEPVVAIGDLFFARKDYGKAIDRYDVALALAPEHAMAYCRRGLSHFHERHDEDALDDLRRAKALDPDIPAIDRHIELAQRRVQRGVTA